MATKDYYTSSTSIGSVRACSIYRMSDAQPDWAEKDPSQPDYIKNKELAERFRPVFVNDEEVLDDSYKSGNLNLVGGKNITLTVDGNKVVISAKSSGGGSTEGGSCDCPEYVEGAGIDITENIYGQKEISVEPSAISTAIQNILGATNANVAANTEAIAVINTYIGTNVTPKITALEAADVEIIEHVKNNGTAVTGIVTRLDGHDTLLAGIGGEGQPATVVAAIEAAKYILPGATVEALGGIKSAADVDGKVAVNKVYVDATTNIAEIKAISTDNLIQGTMTLVLNGGDAQITA